MENIAGAMPRYIARLKRWLQEKDEVIQQQAEEIASLKKRRERSVMTLNLWANDQMTSDALLSDRVRFARSQKPEDEEMRAH